MAEIMLRRTLLASIALIAASHVFARAARAAEAASPQIADVIGAGLTEAERDRIAGRLLREGLVLVGGIRRKGTLIVAVADQQGVPWRLVIDSQSGDIIGRRALAETASLPR
jgi:hypothetical protein